MFLYKKELTPVVTFPEIGAPSTMDLEGRIITLEFDKFFVTQVYTPNAGDGLKRSKNAKDLQIFWPKDLQIPSAMSMVMSQNATLGGHNVARHQKSTTQAGESTIG